jgi:hypothetical protein
MHVNADELGCLFEVDFASFWAHVEEEEARRNSKDDDCEKDLRKLTEQEDGNLTRMVVESLKHEKEMIEERPNIVLDERTKELAQADVLQGEVQEEAAHHGPWHLASER